MCFVVGGAHCGYQLYLSSTIIVSTHVPFSALPDVCFSGYFCNLSLAGTVSLVKSAEGQIIGPLSCENISFSRIWMAFIKTSYTAVYTRWYCSIARDDPHGIDA